MELLSLLGVHNDGEHLVLVDAEGARYILPIDDDLRSKVRPGRQTLVALHAQAGGQPGLREIQAMIRAGATPQEISSETGLPVEHIARSEGPILSERQWIATRARQTAITQAPGTPSLGDLVIDRLATRGVEPETQEWDATRIPGHPWQVYLRFIQNARNMEAVWEFDTNAGILRPLDEQAHWLTDIVGPDNPNLSDFERSNKHTDTTDLPSYSPKVTTKDGTTKSADVSSDQASDSSVLLDMPRLERTQAILDELSNARGRRLQATDGNDDVSAMAAAVANNFREEELAESPDESAPVVPLSSAILAKKQKQSDNPNTDESPTHELRQNSDSGNMLPGMSSIPKTVEEPSQIQTKPTRSISRKSTKRRSIPSWDEIIVGPRNE